MLSGYFFFVKGKKKGKEPKNSICDNFVLVMNFHWMLLDNFYGELVCGCFIGKEERARTFLYVRVRFPTGILFSFRGCRLLPPSEVANSKMYGCSFCMFIGCFAIKSRLFVYGLGQAQRILSRTHVHVAECWWLGAEGWPGAEGLKLKSTYGEM